MMVAGSIAVKLGYFSNEDLQRQKKILIRAGLPIYVPKNISNKKIIEASKRDKKTENGKVMYCLPRKIGTMMSFESRYVISVEDSLVEQALDLNRKR